MRKKMCRCKRMALVLAAVTVMADWMWVPAGMTAYASEKRLPKELVARPVQEPETAPAADGEAEEAGTAEDGAAEMTAEDRETEQKVDAYFDDAVFVGDSIMLGFRNYAMKRQEDAFLSKLQFLAAGSYSANNALWDLSNKDSVHPVYQGEPRYVWDSIAMMGSKKVFIMLGMNDLNVTGLEGTWEKYEELLNKIKESSPGVEIHIIGMTYILHGKEVGKLENNTIREYNSMLTEMAKENGLGFVNIADSLADENGDLAAEYCSDEFAHQNAQAYDIWVSVLRDYAKGQLEKTEYARSGQEEAENGEGESAGNENKGNENKGNEVASTRQGNG